MLKYINLVCMFLKYGVFKEALIFPMKFKSGITYQNVWFRHGRILIYLQDPVKSPDSDCAEI